MSVIGAIQVRNRLARGNFALRDVAGLLNQIKIHRVGNLHGLARGRTFFHHLQVCGFQRAVGFSFMSIGGNGSIEVSDP